MKPRPWRIGFGFDIQGLETIEDLHKRLMTWTLYAPKEVQQVLRRAAELVRREVQETHLSGPKMPRGVGDPQNATLAVQSGKLRRSISLRVAAATGSFSAEVGTKVGYGRKHELGLDGMPERPFLSPSLEKMHQGVFDMIRIAFLKYFKYR